MKRFAFFRTTLIFLFSKKKFEEQGICVGVSMHLRKKKDDIFPKILMQQISLH